VDISEDETPPPPSFFEHQLPYARAFVKGGDPKNLAKTVRIDNAAETGSPLMLRELAAQFAPVLEFFVMGQARKMNACRLYIVYETEAAAVAVKKALHGKTHQLSQGAFQVECGRLETKSKSSRDRRERRKQPNRNDIEEHDDMSWAATNMWTGFPGNGLHPYPHAPFPDLALSFMPSPVFPEAPAA
jgi:hypothetical protein